LSFTREIEESITSHPNVAEVAVVGVEDKIKGQVAVAFAILKDATVATSEKDVMALVDHQLGAVARPARVYFVTQLPKTRSGKLLRRSIQAICEGRNAGDLTSIEDPSSLQQIKEALL
jgi:propionyl-CoA synthetase